MRIVFFTVFAATAGLASAQPPANKEPGNARLICRSEARTGTRFETRICHTKAEWDALAEVARRDARDFIDRPKPNQTSEH